MNDCVEGDIEPVVVLTLGRKDGGLERFLTPVASVFVAGVSVDWRAVLGQANFVEFPTYSFDHKRF